MRVLRLVVLCVVTLACGCVKLDQTLTIKSDGSGSCVLLYSVSEQTITQMKAMLQLQQQMNIAAGKAPDAIAGDDYTRLVLSPDENAIRAAMKKHEANGITVNKVEIATRDGWRQVRLKVMFRDLAGLAETCLLHEYGLLLAKTPEGNYVLRLDAADPDKEAIKSFSNAGSATALRPILGGFNVVLRLKTPGKIIETNGQVEPPYEASWTFDFDRNPKALLALQHSDLVTVFDGKGVNIPTVTAKR